MNSSRIKYIFIAAATLLLMSFLYIKTKSIDTEKHKQLLNNISHYIQIDTTLNQHILEIRQGLLTFYDPTVGKTTQLNELMSKIESLLNQLNNSSAISLTPLLNASAKTLAVKRKMVEEFKSLNALFTNSIRYLPTATEQLIDELSKLENTQKTTLLLMQQLQYSLAYNQSHEPAILNQLAEINIKLKHIFERRYPELLDKLITLQAHANITIKNKIQLAKLITQLINIPSSQQMNTLLDTYLVIHDKKNRQINNYQQVLYTLSIMLLIFVAYILFRLNRASMNLKKTIRALDEQKFAMDQHAIVSIADNNGKITYANQKFCDITGYSSNEIIGKTHDIIKSGYHPDSFFKEIEISGQPGEVWHGRVRHKNKTNEHYWTDTTFVSFVNENDTTYQFITIQTDITDIKEAQEKLHLQSSALEVAANGILITDSNGVILWTNKAFTKITGYTLSEVINKTTDFLNSGKQDASFFKNIWDTILDGQAWHGEIINRKKDGSLYTEEQTISPVLNSNGEISHFISIKQDVSSRKQTEEALRRSQKMDAIGQLSGGIAHDFNNQLGIVIGYLDFLKEVFSDDPRPSRYIENASKAAVRCVDLTRQLLIFSRNQKKETTIVDLNLLLQEQRTMITRSITPEIDVQYYLADGLWPTVANSGEFQDAILNLAINARDAMPNGGKLLIETSNKTFDEQFSKNNPGIIAGEYAQIMISDTGTGMDTETQEHIFEPFYTTKPEGKGTGLGLAMVYGFVKRYKGYIKVYSEPGIGTTFRLHLPRSVSLKNKSGNLSALKTDLPGGNESILIVDDETDLLELAKSYLFDLGYRTFVAKNAHQALEILARESSINLLFSDVVMPGGMNGYELAKKTSEEYPHIKILLTSGFTSKTIAQNGLARFSTNLLDKPYRKADLAARIRLVLDEEIDS